MRRKTGLVIGACVALALAGTASAVALTGNGDSPVGIWHEAPAVPRTPVAAQGKAPAATTSPTTGAPRPEASDRVEKARVSPSAPAPSRQASAAAEPGRIKNRPLESATATGRQRVGELLPVRKVLEYLTGPKQEKFHYPGASYVKLHFDRLDMLPGDYLTVSNPAKTESYRYEATEDPRWAMSITGDTAVVTMHRAANPLGLGDLLGNLGVGVDRVAKGYKRSPAAPGREESVCGADTSSDAVCYQSADPVAYTKSKAIARLLINGTELCTGWRVGPNNRMITNNHCLTSTGEAYDTEVWFNYQCAKCGGMDVFKPTKVWGDKVIATDKTLDFTLFTVDGFAAIEKFGYLTLDTARPARGQELYVPQHPAGEPTRIAGAKGEKAGNCAVENPDYTGYAPHSDVSYYCDTAGGSSGSPVLSRRTNKVVALHHFGGCPNSGVRGDLLAAKLRTYL
ncbi:trypsin-like peptidase domain-containing protein [Actinoplanes sp. NPDC023714]|uniref:trypsin-like peptidase domain-containing protein n=1 Tax=Actinoplanes sp. NPDC023714 TaxID=3154322 RepID=UPI0033E02B06